jgi:multiple sugar transport system ATP-binding protein
LRDTAMVFQNYALYPHMTVAQNMSFALRIKKVPKAEIDAKVRAAAEIIGLTPYLDRLPRQLSGGQRQRVAMGRAIVRSPKVFLFDEPLSNLDAKLRVQMRTEIKSLHQRLKTTTIYVTHDQIEAMTMADRIVVMNAGRVEQMGPPLELYDNPANLFVASFIGSPAMNLYEGVVADGHFIADESAAFRVPVPAGFPSTISGKVVYGIRPEHLRMVQDGDGLPAVVRLIEPTGAEMQVLMDVDGVKLTGVFRDRIAIEMNRSIKIAPEDSKALLFEKSTGVRIKPASQTDTM